MKKPAYLLLALTLCMMLDACASGQNETADANDSTDAESTATQTVVIEKINTSTLKEMLNSNIQLVDVRTPEEVAQGHIDGAITDMNFLNGQFESKITELDPEQPVVIYCARGGRSAKAAALLKEKGFKKIYDYTDGYNGWSAQ